VLPRILVIALLAAALIFSCSENKLPYSPPITPPSDPLDQTPREDAEAEHVALYLSGELVAPQELYEEVRDGLALVRAQYQDSMHEVIRFRGPCWMPGEIAVDLTDEATIEVRNGTYTDMDSLNAALRLAQMDTISFGFRPERIYFHLYFEGRLHPQRVREMYDLIPSILYTSYGYLCLDSSQFYPWLIDGGVSYLFRRAWGDCPAGCTDEEFWYFRVRMPAVEYVGHWHPRSEPEPGWWAEARAGYCELTKRPPCGN
jgi:hypothetical protein